MNSNQFLAFFACSSEVNVAPKRTIKFLLYLTDPVMRDPQDIIIGCQRVNATKLLLQSTDLRSQI